ncbi:hypothetical protein GPECTOR_33g549 [Gonium pectorale]|uniref:Uncharacterized protein n=1 Tax=Gonium pectorale TaxID=33097 RepID=A0A150GCU7_GONPE|nr:hypothetical protein GPECTOR_33g549 [Gonium pectorale]|eukprot:KXZ47667.1 hypothetical protein GPECTOR_33g549 [Gonium pectorale]
MAARVFGSAEGRRYARQVCAIATAIATAPDAPCAVRAAAAQLETLLNEGSLAPGAALPRLNVAIGLVVSKAGSGAACAAAIASATATSATATAADSVSASCSMNSIAAAQQSAVAAASASTATASISSWTATCSTASATSAAALLSPSGTGSGGGGGGGGLGWPQMQLFCTPCGAPPVLLPIRDTLLCTPVRADATGGGLPHWSLLTAGAAAVSSSSGSRGISGPGSLTVDGRRPPPAAGPPQQAAASASLPAPHATPVWTQPPAQQPYQGRPQRLLTLRSPEHQLQAQELRSDLAALRAAGVRATRGSVVFVSCPLPSTLSAIAVYVCPVPPEERDLGSAAAGAGGEGDSAGAATAVLGADCSPSVQLSEAQMDMVARTVSSTVEVVASTLELRVAQRRGPQRGATSRFAGRGPAEQELTTQDGSTMLTLSEACVEDADADAVFWGSASGLDMSSESALTFQPSLLSPGASGPSARGSTSNTLPAQPGGPVGVHRRAGALSAMRCADVAAASASRTGGDADSAILTTAQSELLLSACASAEGSVDGAEDEAEAERPPGALVDAAPARAAAAAAAAGGLDVIAAALTGEARAESAAVADPGVSGLGDAHVAGVGFPAVCTALEGAGSSTWGLSTGCDPAVAEPKGLQEIDPAAAAGAATSATRAGRAVAAASRACWF